MLAALGTDVRDAVDHQHIVGRQLCVTGTEQFAVAAGDQFLFGERTLGCHKKSIGRWQNSVGFAVLLSGAIHAPVSVTGFT
jgi:hypothetical protein